MYNNSREIFDDNRLSRKRRANNFSLFLRLSLSLFAKQKAQGVDRREGGLLSLPSPVEFFASSMVFTMGMVVVLPVV
jgi:hypothetical protein